MKKKWYQTADGHVCEQKFASVKNERIIPRKFHSSLITAVKNRLSPHWGNSRLSREYIFLGIRRTGLSTVPAIPLPSFSRSPPTFSTPFSTSATQTVRFVYLPFRLLPPTAQSRQAFVPRAEIILVPRAISLSRSTICALTAKGMTRTSWR